MDLLTVGTIEAPTRRESGHDQHLLSRLMATVSAGVLLYRNVGEEVELLIAHPGGPFWARQDAGSWSIPKGEVDPGESLEEAAVREFEEETGLRLPEGPRLGLGSVELRSGKEVHAWALEGDCDPRRLVSNTFTIEWPPRSGQIAEFPEIDRFRWVDSETAAAKLNGAQVPFVERLLQLLKAGGLELDHLP